MLRTMPHMHLWADRDLKIAHSITEGNKKTLPTELQIAPSVSFFHRHQPSRQTLCRAAAFQAFGTRSPELRYKGAQQKVQEKKPKKGSAD